MSMDHTEKATFCRRPRSARMTRGWIALVVGLLIAGSAWAQSVQGGSPTGTPDPEAITQGGGGANPESGGGYDPLHLDPGTEGQFLDLTVPDAGRNREIPLRVYLPRGTNPAPVVVFSHGLGGSRENAGYLGRHWSGRGFAVVYIQHPGSDDSVWKGARLGQRMSAMNGAADVQNLLLRLKDVPVALDQLEVWNREAGHPLAGRLDMTRVGMSGHSFGALTTQSLCGQSAPMVGQRFTLPGIKAAIMFSPSVPRRGDPAQAFGSVKIPWMLMTGTRDEAPIGGQTVAMRLGVFPALPPGSKYEIVLFDAEHYAFTERDVKMTGSPRNPNHHRVILALSTAFWDAYLNGDQAARTWLDASGPSSLLEPRDRWQKK